MNIRLLKKWRNEASKLFDDNVVLDITKTQFCIELPYVSHEFNEFNIKTRDYYIGNNADDKNTLFEAKLLVEAAYKYRKSLIDNYVLMMLRDKKREHPYKGFRIKFFKIKRR